MQKAQLSRTPVFATYLRWVTSFMLKNPKIWDAGMFLKIVKK